MNQSYRYSGIGTINHWITAILVTAMLTLGLLAHWSVSDEVEHFVMQAHIGLGFFTLLFVVWRIGFRLYEGFPPAAEGKTAERWLAYWVHRALLLVLALLVITGPLYLFTEGEGISVFGWFTVAIPLESLAVIHEPAESVHVVSGLYLLPALLVLHLGGAVKHFLKRGRTATPADLD